MSKPKLLFDYTKVDSKKVHRRIVVFAFIPIILMIMYFQIKDPNLQFVPFSLFAIIFGLFLEDIKLTKEWSDIFRKTSIAFLLSLVVFWKGKREFEYNFQSHLDIWPYAFIIIYILIAIPLHGRKVIPKLNEGLVLIQTLAVIYWVSELGISYFDNIFLITFVCLGLIFSVYSLYHSFTYTPLTRKHRLTLSLWSSILILIFSIDNIYRIYSYNLFNDVISINEKVLIYHQYFLLGVSGIYIVQNLLMLTDYLPNKNDEKGEYKLRIKKATFDHIVRFSNKQFKISHSIAWFIILTITFSINYYYHFLPINIMIGTVFFIFPRIMNFIEKKTNPRDNAILNSTNTLNLN